MQVYVMHDAEAPECSYAVSNADLAAKLTRLESEQGLCSDMVPMDLLDDDEALERIAELERDLADDCLGYAAEQPGRWSAHWRDFPPLAAETLAWRVHAAHEGVIKDYSTDYAINVALEFLRRERRSDASA